MNNKSLLIASLVAFMLGVSFVIPIITKQENIDNITVLGSGEPWFGNKDAYLSFYQYLQGYILGGNWTNTAGTGYATNITVYLGWATTNSSRAVKCAIYNSTTNAFINATEEVNRTWPAGWYSFNFSGTGCLIVNNVKYRIVCWAAPSPGTLGLGRSATTGGEGVYLIEALWSGWPETAPFNTNGYKYMEYCTFTNLTSEGASWQQLDQWNGTLYNTSDIIQLDSNNGTLWNQSNTIQLDQWNGTLWNVSNVKLVQTWNGTLYNSSKVTDIQTWNGTLYNVSVVQTWQNITTWNGTIYNLSNAVNLQQWNGTLWNKSNVATLQQWNGTLFNKSYVSQIMQWNGTLFNKSNVVTLMTWNGTLWNVSASPVWQNIMTWNGTLYNISERSWQEIFPPTPLIGQISQYVKDSFEWSNVYMTAVNSPTDLLRVNQTEYYISTTGASYGFGDTSQIKLIQVYNDSLTFNKTFSSNISYDSNDAYRTGLTHISGDVYATINGQNYAGKTQIQTYHIRENGTMSSISTFVSLQNCSRGITNLIHVYGGVYAVIYQEDMGGYDYKMDTIWINDSGTINRTDFYITNLDSENFDITPTGSAYNGPTATMIDNDTIAIVWTEYSSEDGEIATYNISSSGIITSIPSDSWEFDSGKGTYPYIYKITNNKFAIAYIDTDDHGWVKTINITDEGTITKSWNDTLEFSNSGTTHKPIIFPVSSGEVYGITYNDVVCTFNMTSDGTLGSSNISFYTFGWSTLYNNIVYVNESAYLVIFSKSEPHIIYAGEADILEIYTPNTVWRWHGTLFNSSDFNTLNQWNGTLFNKSNGAILQTWNGTIYNSSTSNTINTWNGTLYNLSVSNTIQVWNGTIFNTSLFREIVTWNGTLYNLSSFIEIERFNGTLYNVSLFLETDLWTGTLYNSSEVKMSCTITGVTINCSYCGTADEYRWETYRNGESPGDSGWCPDCSEQKWTFETGGPVEIKLSINDSGNISSIINDYTLIQSGNWSNPDNSSLYNDITSCLLAGYYWWNSSCHNCTQPYPHNAPYNSPDAGKNFVEQLSKPEVQIGSIIFLFFISTIYIYYKRNKKRKKHE